MMKQDFHVFQGMKQDNHPIRQESKYLWEAHNIRFTAREDNTLLSMTNERGTKDLELPIRGAYVGHCVVNDYLIVFTSYISLDDVKTNYIFRIQNIEGTLKCDALYSKDLNMSAEYPAQTLGVYEGDLVQKVYWVDSRNSPRVINIVADKLRYNKDFSQLTTEEQEALYPKGCFDFIQDLELSETVEVQRKEGDGSFSPGILQYAFSYYNKYGQESNIFYTTGLYNISFKDRGGSPEDNIANTFHININDIDTRFQYLRIYSIHRTSLDAVPTVKILEDISINYSIKSTSYTDKGLSGTNIDPTKLLYIGGESIVAGTIVEKDNTLFLGNIKLVRASIDDKLKTLVQKGTLEYSTRTINVKSNYNTSSFYSYSSQLFLENPTSFKIGEFYRLGVQFQYKTGKWSEPVWLWDSKVPENDMELKPHIDETNNIVVPKIVFTLTEETLITLTSLGYKKVRPLVVLPSNNDKNILAQGILCPTVFSANNRTSNSPFSQASWFFRPISNNFKTSVVDGSTLINNDSNIEEGATVEFRHLEPLLGESDRGAEIQNMFVKKFYDVNAEYIKNSNSNMNTFFVDQSIVTMHSPDIEFDDSIKQLLNNGNYALHIVGVVPFKSNVGDISIQTSSPPPSPYDKGFIHKILTTKTEYSNKALVSGLFYKSHVVDDSKNAKEFNAWNATDSNWEMSWLIYPWHRTGSLNNDVTRPEGSGTRTSVLKRKVISNLKFSPDTIWANSTWSSFVGGINRIAPISIFNSNEISLVRLPTIENTGIKEANYYGNIDTLVTTDRGYNLFIGPNEGVHDVSFAQLPLKSINNYELIGDYKDALSFPQDPVRMRYKSTPHAIIAFNGINTKHTEGLILPTVNKEINKYQRTSDPIPFWSDIVTNIKYENKREAVVENVVEMSEENTEDIIAHNKVKLEGLGISKYPSYAICTSTFKSSGEGYDKYADLYCYDGQTWSRVTLGQDKVGEVYHVENSSNYWQVDYNGNGWILKKVDTVLSTYTIQQGNISIEKDKLYKGVGGTEFKPFLFMAELRRTKDVVNRFGGTTEAAFQSNLWIPAGKSTKLGTSIEFTYGDTYYQRYDCLKTYPFTTEDENSVVEIASFMCETRINLDGRYDRNRGQVNNLNISPNNFNLLNPVYSQRDTFFNYRILDKQYYRNIKYPTQVLWTLEKTYLEDVDTWTNVTLANSIDLNGANGAITTLESFNDLLLAFQEKSVSQILFNSRVQIPTTDGIPVEISNNYKVDGARLISDTIGCQNKWAMAKSSLGIYFVDSNTDTLYLYNGQLQDLNSQLGIKCWLQKWHPTDSWNIESYSSLRLSYDPNNKDLYISPKGDTDNENTLCYSEQLGQVTSLMSYSNVVMFPMNNKFLSLSYNSRNKETKLWENFKGDYNNFFGEVKYPSFTYICNEEAAYTKIFDTIEYRADLYNNNDNLLHNESFNWIQAYNEYQDSGKKTLTQSRRVFSDTSLRKKFRVWRGQVPRDGRERIRNPWTAITLGFDDKEGRDNNFHFILHDISTKYTV